MEYEQSPGIPIEVVYQNGYQILRIKEHLERGMDLSPLRRAIEMSLAEGKTKIALSLSPDSFLYSEILANIVTYYKMVSAQGGSIWVVQDNEKILFILETLGLTDLISIVSSEDALP